MESGAQGIISTLISNTAIMSFVIVYLFLRERPQSSGTQHLYSSFSKVVSQLYSTTDSEISNLGGQDSLFYLSFLKYLAFILLLFSLIGLVGLLPIYNSQPVPMATSLSQFSIEGMKSEDANLMVPGICGLLFSLGILFAAYVYSNLASQYPEYIPRVTII